MFDVEKTALIEWDYPSPYICRWTAVPADIDVLNHVNNQVYNRWCQDTAVAHSAAIGLGVDRFVELDRAMVLHRAEYEYLKSAVLGDEVAVATWLTATDGRFSLTRRYQIVRLSDRATLLRGCWHLVCTEVSTGKPRRMPALFIDNYVAAVIPDTEKPSAEIFLQSNRGE